MSIHHRRLLDTSSELLIYRHGGGIKLVRPEERHKHKDTPNSYHTGHTVSSYLDLDCCVYFGTTDSQFQRINEADAVAINCASPNAAIGRYPKSFLNKESAERAIQHDIKVMSANRTIVSEETYVWENNVQREFIVVKSPWYDHDNKIVGLFASGSALGGQSVADFLNNVMQIGLLNQAKLFPNNNILSGAEIDGIYLSKRETEVMKQIASGRSARVVGAILSISQRTVETHLENIKRKLNVYSKAELVDKAVHAFYGK